jgi:hypothetical protein
MTQIHGGQCLGENRLNPKELVGAWCVGRRIKMPQTNFQATELMHAYMRNDVGKQWHRSMEANVWERTGFIQKNWLMRGSPNKNAQN